MDGDARVAYAVGAVGLRSRKTTLPGQGEVRWDRSGSRWRRSPLSLAPLVIGVLAGTCVMGALVLLAQANAGVERTWARLGPTPVTTYRATDRASTEPLPVVVIAHGFAGSQQLMQPFAFTFAKNGYLAVTFDFYGHGRNLEPLAGDVTQVEGATRYLLRQTRAVSSHALDLPGAGEGLALLGHSMASDIVVRASERDPRVEATIAVSMFSPAVTSTAPENLLVIVGGLEPFLKQEALRVMGMVTDDPEPGVTYGRFVDGTARRAAFADGVEHVGVLYSPESMEESVAWLDAVFERSGSGYADDRGPAILLLFLGLGLLAWPLARLLPTVSDPPRGAALRGRELVFAGLLPAIGTPVLLVGFPKDFLSVQVGGYLAVHFGVYGLLTAACLAALRWRGGGSSVPEVRPRVGRGLLAAGLSTAYVAGVVGWAMDVHVTSFAITTPRVPLVLTMLAGTLAYFLTDEWMTRGEGTPRLAHLFTRLCFLLSLGVAVALSFEALFFLLIIAVVIVVYFVVYGLFGGWIYRSTGHPAVGAVANAVAFAWALGVVFPMLAS